MSFELRASSFESTDAAATAPRMRRADALAAIYPVLAEEDVVVVTIMGAVAVELYNLGHRPGFFYLEHAMGLASSLGLGLALSLPRKHNRRSIGSPRGEPRNS